MTLESKGIHKVADQIYIELYMESLKFFMSKTTRRRVLIFGMSHDLVTLQRLLELFP